MVIVDVKYRFVWASCGFPGNSHDSLVFRTASFYDSIVNSNKILSVVYSLQDVEIPPVILADSTFLLQSLMTKPFTNTVLSPQICFHYRLRKP